MTPVVALTGGIASGKSAAAARFETHGIQITDADAIAGPTEAATWSAEAGSPKNIAVNL